MKRKLLFMMLCIMGVLAMRAQTDVTSTYLSNPSFEKDGKTIAESTTSNNISDWTFAWSKNDKAVCSVWDNTTNATGYGKEVTPADGDYYSQIRIRWENGINWGSLTQKTTTNLPAGIYTLSVKYKAASVTTEGSISLTAKNGSTSLATKTNDVPVKTPRDNTITCFDDNNEWSSMSVKFSLSTETELSVELKFSANQNSDAIFDDVRLVKDFDISDIYTAYNDGDYWLYNEGAGKYIVGANDWGTRASFDTSGLKMEATLKDGAYTLSTNSTYNGKYLGSNGYVDSSSSNWFFIDSGEEDYYLMMNGSGSFLVWDGEGTATTSVVSEKPTTSAGYWCLKSASDRKNVLETATKASPQEATYLIVNPDFGRNSLVSKGWQSNSSNSNYFQLGGENYNFNLQQWNGYVTMSQNVEGLPNGKYKMTLQGYYRPGSSDTQSTEQNVTVFAGDVETPLMLHSASGVTVQDDDKGFTHPADNGSYAPNTQQSASKAFSNGYYINELSDVVTTTGSLEIGVRNSTTLANQWMVIDNFRLYYYGPTISSFAEELPVTEMEADTWYYFDIATDGNYTLTLTTLNDIVYTTDGTILIEDESSVTDNFDNEVIEFTAGRYYVKSSSSQAMSVTPASYDYVLGEPTFSVGDGQYTQTSTIEVTFPDAVSNDPDASLSLSEGATATVNETTSVGLTSLEGGKGFSLDLGELTADNSYVISIPAGVYGYNPDDLNQAITFTVHTPVVLDGEYVLYDEASKLFLGRGCNWGTEATADKYGVPFNLKTNAYGVSSIEFVDWTGVYLFITGTAIYTDNTSSGWTFEPATGGYYLRDANKTVYACHSTGNLGEYIHTTETESEATVWTLISFSDRNAIVDAYPDDNAKTVAEAAGLTVTSAADLATYLSDNTNTEDYTNFIGTATFSGNVGDWTWSQVRGQDGQPAYGTNFAEVWNATGKFTQTISSTNLPAGIYKLTVQGYERRTNNNATTALGDDGYNLVSSYLKANEEQVRLKNWYDVDGQPTNTVDAVTAFDNGAAINEVYVYLDGNTDLTITLAKPNYIWDCWTIFNNFTLTYYSQSKANMTIDPAAQYGTFIAPFDVTIPKGVTAYTVDDVAANGILTMTEVSTTIPANTPVVVYSQLSDGVNTTFYGKNNSSEDTTEGLLTGVYDDTEINEGYVLQNQDGRVAFFKVIADKPVTVGANRAYLSDSESTSGIKVIFFDGDDTPTGIHAIENLINGEAEIFNTSGVKLPALQKGMNIIRTVDGKVQKVMVK